MFAWRYLRALGRRRAWWALALAPALGGCPIDNLTDGGGRDASTGSGSGKSDSSSGKTDGGKSDSGKTDSGKTDGSLTGPSDAPVCAPGVQQCVQGSRIETCGANGQWGTPWACASGACLQGACTQPPTPDAASCQTAGDGVTSCGNDHQSCCASLEVPGGSFSRTWAFDGGAVVGLEDPASVSGFRLDEYDVTVGRFRPFVAACRAAGGCLPASGAGKHAHLNGGLGLADMHSPEHHEPGWDPAGNVFITPSADDLACNGDFSTWSETPSGKENLPMNCINWYESYAFCIWDGGFLPSETEYRYAMAAGSQQRLYPWGATAPGTTNMYAVVGEGQGQDAACCYPTLGRCSGTTNIAPVGIIDGGIGQWGQRDLSGNVWKRLLDAYYKVYQSPCIDCAGLPLVDSGVPVADGAAPMGNAVLGGPYDDDYYHARSDFLASFQQPNRFSEYGLRCARTP